MSNLQFSKGHYSEDIDKALAAPAAERAAAFAAVRLKSQGGMKPVNPRAGILPAVELLDDLPPFPDDDSETTAAELIQIAMATAWLADTPLRDIKAILEAEGNPLEGLEEALGAPVRPAAAFRLQDPGAAPTPLISQFLLHPFAAGSLAIDQRHRLDLGLHGYRPEALQGLLNGKPIENQVLSSRTHYIYSLRALASAMRQDPPYLYGLLAMLQLEGMGPKKAPRSGLFPPLPAEAGFVAYGGALDAQCLLVEAVREAMSLCWLQKWRAGSPRRARPEELLAYPERLHPLWAERGAPLLQRLGVGPHLPLLSAAGAPAHPSYVSGHSVIGGAVATTINAIYADGRWPIVMMQANDTGSDLIGSNANTLTIHGEARKLGENYGMGRVVGGLHFLSDVREGLLLGQLVAEQVLRRAKARAQELGIEEWGSTSFKGYFDTTVSI
jgi:hypothetical protein